MPPSRSKTPHHSAKDRLTARLRRWWAKSQAAWPIQPAAKRYRPSSWSTAIALNATAANSTTPAV